MRPKLLITAVLVLCLSKFASPNECARCGRDSGTKKAQPVKPATRAETADTESSTLVINKLLYI